ncbi:Diacylglycerol kinase zeta [Bagarius yarrelli]|uniref:Diacylglycerol kinase zeta n=1 Tax=Bagarius yarrelli TaxID=175774 RepID=A0A556THY6_BAGYA|nr:Diacylglycerol kinase zeta [Bagarius yarrelli]
MRDYETLHYDKDQLKKASIPLGIISVRADSDLETCRMHIERIYEEGDGVDPDPAPVPKLSPKWCFLDSTTADRFYRIDRAQEHLNYVTEISQNELFILDPELVTKETVGTSTGMQDMVDTLEENSNTSDQIAFPASSPLYRSDDMVQNEIDKELHKEGASLAVYDAKGCTLLHYAVDTGNKEMVRYIIDNAPLSILDVAEKDTGETALHKAAALCQRSICSYLVDAGASLTKTDLQGNTAKTHAKRAQDLQLTEYLENQQHHQMIQRDKNETEV